MAKPGGLLSFTHKTSVWPDWEEEQDRLEAAGLWQKVWVSIKLLIVGLFQNHLDVRLICVGKISGIKSLKI